jgi:hypothetical protein
MVSSKLVAELVSGSVVNRTGHTLAIHFSTKEMGLSLCLMSSFFLDDKGKIVSARY